MVTRNYSNQIGKCFGANPSPEGRGCREAAGEGYHRYSFSLFSFLNPSPGPLTRATLSLRARDLPQTFSTLIRLAPLWWFD
jgi:hypothetical protein